MDSDLSCAHVGALKCLVLRLSYIHNTFWTEILHIEKYYVSKGGEGGDTEMLTLAYGGEGGGGLRPIFCLRNTCMSPCVDESKVVRTVGPCITVELLCLVKRVFWVPKTIIL